MTPPASPLILIVDDNTDQLNLLKAALGERFDVLTASDGLDAYALACNAKPRAIILDVVMPLVDGWTVLRKMRSNPETKRIPVIIFSALEVDAIQGDAKTLGAAAVIRKPASARELEAALRRVIPS